MKEEFAVFLTMIEPPDTEGIESDLAEAMKRLPPVDYSFVAKTLEFIEAEPEAKYWTRCLCAAVLGNPFAMRSLQSHFLRRSSAAPFDGLYSYWDQAQAKTGIGELCGLGVVEKTALIARAYHNRETPPLEDGKPYFTCVEALVARLEGQGYDKAKDPVVFALAYCNQLFEKTSMTPDKLSAFGDSVEQLDEMKRLADLIVICNREVSDATPLPSEVQAVSAAMRF